MGLRAHGPADAPAKAGGRTLLKDLDSMASPRRGSLIRRRRAAGGAVRPTVGGAGGVGMVLGRRPTLRSNAGACSAWNVPLQLHCTTADRAGADAAAAGMASPQSGINAPMTAGATRLKVNSPRPSGRSTPWPDTSTTVRTRPPHLRVRLVAAACSARTGPQPPGTRRRHRSAQRCRAER